jgi:hypothetical protein
MVATVAFLAGCAGFGASSSAPASLEPGASLEPSASLPSGDQTLTAGCFLTPAEVEAATGRTLTRAPEGSFGPKGDASCLYYLEGELPIGAFGCHCLGTNGPFDLQGQGTAWLEPLPSDGETVPGVGDKAYLLNGSTGNEFWAVKGQIGIHLGIDGQSLTVEQFTVLANAAFDRIAGGA